MSKLNTDLSTCVPLINVLLSRLLLAYQRQVCKEHYDKLPNKKNAVFMAYTVLKGWC